MTSNHFYHKQPQNRPNRRDRVLVIDAANKPDRPITNPDSVKEQYINRHLKIFIVILLVMIGLMMFSIKLVEYLWVRRDSAVQTISRPPPVRSTPAVLSTDAPAPVAVKVPDIPPINAVPAVSTEPKRIASSGSDTIFRWGKVLEEAGELEGALERYREAMLVDPGNVTVLTQAGRLTIRMGKYADAVEFLTIARDQSNDNADIMNDLGVALTFNGQEQEAVKLYDKLLELHPDYVPALFNQGYAMVQIQDYPAARPKLEMYLAKRPDDAMALGVMAVLELAEKNDEKALELLDRAIKASPDWIMPYLDAATICVTLDRFDQALGYLEKALEVGSPSDVYRRFQSNPFSPLRLSDQGRVFESKIAEAARKTMK